MSCKQALTAVIFDRKGRVLSIGQNSYTKTHTLQAKYAKSCGRPESVYLHAEIHALVRCKDLLRAYRIFVSRFDKSGAPRMAKPCNICDSAIKAAGIKIIEWTVDQ